MAANVAFKADGRICLKTSVIEAKLCNKPDKAKAKAKPSWPEQRKN